MNAVVFAYSTIGCAGLAALLDRGVTVAAVFTHPDDPGETAWFRSVAAEAAARGLPVYAPEDVNHPLWLERIRALGPDVLFSFYYRKLLGPELLALPPRGAFNLHGSLLPRYRGRCPVNWALINGETETGLTLHHMVARADAGDIVGQSRIAIEPDDTARTLNEKLAAAVPDLLSPLLPAIAAGTAPRQPQDEAEASYYGGRKPEDGRIDWRRPAAAVRNLVRAVTRPYPGAFTSAGGRTLFIWEAAVEEDNGGAAPGTVLSTDPFRIACGEGALRVVTGQAENGVIQTGGQLAADCHLGAGMRFHDPAVRPERKTRVLILGVNGFIGNALSERLLADGRFEIIGMDRNHDQIERFLGNADFTFIGGDITIHRETMRDEISQADVVLPLVAIATPIEYV
ncbi:MAG: formyltransferase, partial [Planctomycetes bacterium]|nr:formyltransferase [Planctomycetota bacterium]